MRKLLLIADCSQDQPIKSSLEAICKSLSPQEYDITLLTKQEADILPDHFPPSMRHLSFKNIQAGEVSFSNRALQIYYELSFNKRLHQQINKMKFDVVVCFQEGPLMKFTSQLDAPMKIGFMAADYSTHRWTEALMTDQEELAVLKKFRSILCCNKTVRKAVIREVGDPGNLLVFPYPFDEAEMRKLAKQPLTFEMRSLSQISPSILSRGSLDERNDYFLLLEAVKQLNEENYYFSVIILGEGKDREELDDYIHKHKLQNVRLLHEPANPYQWLANADWYLSLKRFGGYDPHLLEAAIIGLPIIVLNRPANQEFMGHFNENGLFFEHSLDQLHDVLSQALSVKNLKRYYANQIREWIRSVSGKQIMADFIILLEGGTPSSAKFMEDNKEFWEFEVR